MQFDLVDGPLSCGDLIIIEVNGHLIPKVSDKTKPQLFVVLNNQEHGKPVKLEPFNTESVSLKPKKYIASGCYF